MLRRAVTESASRTAAAARERLAASLADRPEVNVSVVVHAPRVAAPSFRYAAGDDEADADAATVILDLGRFQLDSCGALELGASPETAKLFNAFKIRVSDVSASVASGRWDPSRAWTVETFDDVAPVIPAFGARATALQALAPVSGRAGLEVTFDADAVRVALSPAASRSSCPSSPMSQRRLRRRRVGWRRRGTTRASPTTTRSSERKTPKSSSGGPCARFWWCRSGGCAGHPAARACARTPGCHRWSFTASGRRSRVASRRRFRSPEAAPARVSRSCGARARRRGVRGRGGGGRRVVRDETARTRRGQGHLRSSPRTRREVPGAGPRGARRARLGRTRRAVPRARQLGGESVGAERGSDGGRRGGSGGAPVDG